uniref:APC family permease n=1 Tax=uncultured Sphingomonas sp. TaxID=158754 RepID=UPI0035CAE186
MNVSTAGNLDVAGPMRGQELRRALRFSDLVVYGMVFMLPIAPFSLFGIVNRASNGLVPLAYMMGAVVMAFTARSYGLLSARIPLAGSVYTYTRMGLNETFGFLAGWLILLDYLIAPGLMYVISAASLHGLVPQVARWEWIVVFTIVGTSMNVVGIQFAARANKTMLVAMLVVLLIFLAVGTAALVAGKGAGALRFDMLFDAQRFAWPAMGTAILISSTNFLGFDAITTLAEEVVLERRPLIGWAGLTTLAIIAALFFVQCWVAAALVPGAAIRSDDTAFYDIAGYAGGSWLYTLTSVTTALAFGISCAVVCQSAIARILFAMGRDRQIPAILARLHPRTKQPYVANICVGCVSLVIGLFFQDRIADLALFQNFGALSAFVLVNASVIGFFWVRHGERSVFAHLVTPLVGMVANLALLLAMRLETLILGAAWLAVGLIYIVVLRLVLRRSVSIEA